MSKAILYLDQQLGACGFVLLDAGIAFRTRRDLWPTRTNAGQDFNAPELRRKLVERAPVLFRFHGDEYCGIGGAFSAERLTDRIRELYGLRLEIDLVSGQELMQVKQLLPPSVGPNPRTVERLAKLRNLAAHEPPEHDCSLRRQIRAAREKVSRLEAGGNT